MEDGRGDPSALPPLYETLYDANMPTLPSPVQSVLALKA